ncbi:MAG: hypothetical protein KBD63_00490 [Bacteriovoracaceae bacterium]|nr:hypothetical protein [Bacteriovoracaceae bacterium]
MFITVKITKVTPHPNAHKLKICEVFNGTENYQIVCGASNVREGMLTILAPVGSTLPSGTNIGKATLRGVESEGMLCSPKELGLSDETGLIDLSPTTSVGVSLDSLDKKNISSTPWYLYKKVESFWQKKNSNSVVVSRDITEEPSLSEFELISQTFFHEGIYHYRHFL